MRVIYVIESLPGGGAERVAVEMAMAMRERGDEVAIVSIRKPDAEDPILEQSIGERGIRHFFLGKTPGRWSLNAFFSLVKIIRDFNADLVHTHGPSPDIYGGFAALCAGKRFVRTFHAIGLHYKIEVLFFERLLSLFSIYDSAVSETVRQWALCALKIDGKKIRTLYNGVKLEVAKSRDPQKVYRVREKFGADGSFIVVSTGRLNREKGFDLLIRAAGILRAEGLKVRVVIAGEGAERRNLEALIASLGLEERVILAGYANSVFDMLAASDIFVLPSFREGHSMSLVEAMAAGIPVIASDLQANREVLGKNGCYFRCGDERSLAERLREVSSDRTLRSRLIALSNERAAMFSFDRMMNEYTQLYSIALK